MAYSARIILDSVSPVGHRLTTFEVTYPRFVHSEMLTHRMFSRNSASSRAIPNRRLIERVEHDPVMPVWWGKNQSGMQAEEEIDEGAKVEAIGTWLRARRSMLKASEELSRLGVHKQLCNRLIEPWMLITTIITATEFSNFFKLRCHPDAQPEIRQIALMMRDLYQKSTPTVIEEGGWHIPYVEDLTGETLFVRLRVSAARCARLSYLRHDGKRDLEADVDLSMKLRNSGHWSPFEHQAQAAKDEWYGNFFGWKQHRKFFWNEDGRLENAEKTG